MSSSRRITSAAFLVLLVVAGTMNTASAIYRSIEFCQPGTVERQPKGIQNICSALKSSKEFNDAVSAYLKKITEEKEKVVASASIELCQPGTIERQPEGIQKVCSALGNSKELNDRVFAYLKQINEEQVKTQTPMPDHIIFRIGRRR